MVDLKAPVTRFSATSAAFTGFRLMGREPATVAVWGAVYVAFTLLMGAAMVVTIGPSMTALRAQQQAGAVADPTASLAMLSRLLPFEGLALLGALVFYALLAAAVNRAVLRPGVGGPGRLALGGDEGRQLLLFVILGALLFVAYLVLVIAAAAVGVAVVLALVGANRGAAAAGPAVAIALVMITLVLAALLGLATRLSLASPMTFDTGRVDAFGSWRMTRGVAWPLFGAYLMIWLLVLLLYVAALIVFSLIAAAVGGGLAAAGVALHPDTSSLGAYFAPLMLLWTLMLAAVGTVALALTLAAPAGAYAQLKALGRLPPSPSLPGTGVAPAPTPASDLPRFGA